MDDGLELRTLGEFGGDFEWAVERDAGVEQRGDLFGEVQQVGGLGLASEAGDGEGEAAGLFGADEDGREALLAEFARGGAVVFDGEGAEAGASVGGQGFVVEDGHG